MIQTRSISTPFDLLALHRLDPQRYPVLLESSSGGALGRWDMLLAHAGDGFALHRDGVVRTLAGEVLAGRFLDVLDARWQAAQCAPLTASALPFRGGWALLLGYELAQQVEPILQLPAPDGGCDTLGIGAGGHGYQHRIDTGAGRLRGIHGIGHGRAG